MPLPMAPRPANVRGGFEGIMLVCVMERFQI